MLVLTRKLDEQIQIGDDVVITILRVKGNTVRIGIEAPHSTRIIRAELPRHDGPSPATDTPSANVHAPATESVPGRVPSSAGLQGHGSQTDGTPSSEDKPADTETASLDVVHASTLNANLRPMTPRMARPVGRAGVSEPQAAWTRPLKRSMGSRPTAGLARSHRVSASGDMSSRSV